MAQSIEPNIADLANGWLKSYKLDYKLEQEYFGTKENPTQIDKALDDYFSKNGGVGGNRPDAKLLLQDKHLNHYPIIIEYKGDKNKLVKLDSNGQVDNKTAKNEPNFKNINSFAVNGAVHYANALLHHTIYTDIIAIGMTGYKDEAGNIKHEIGVYFVSKTNLAFGQKVKKEYSDFSFLKKENFDAFIEEVKKLTLSQEEIDKLKEQREREIDISLVKLNNDIYKNEKGLGENDRVYLVAASIIATIGIVGKVQPLEKEELKSSTENGYTDGEIIVRKIESFLENRELPKAKKDLIVRTLSNTLLTENINKVENGESQLRRVFTKIVDDLGIYYKIGLTTDFTGKLFNEMYGWLGFTQDKLNDVVLTPSYIATLLVKLARVNKDSFVWDFATGSAGLLVAAMNEMLIDAKNTITSPDELTQKEIKIKAEQLLGLELLSSVYMLAILNMILMGDGSSNILNKDSLSDFDGNYGFGKTDSKFPADAFVLNPPYSANGNGMNFVEKALGMMNKGYAAIIIQNSAGSGKAKEYTKKILEKHTLLASIKMPVDIFIGKSSVQTNIYVFKVNEKHHKDDVVKFIDFSNDGYTRTNRKKASNNLKDTDRAKERYEELVNLVRFGKSKLTIFTEKEYHEGTIDPQNGEDWNQTAPIDTKPTLQNFKKTVSDYLAWEVSNLLKQNREDDSLGK
ncbi:MAG: N-6 DNA methylase [Methylococcales bacterium]|nr:N-6 DNA methylase [Methylococcales bacterium]